MLYNRWAEKCTGGIGWWKTFLAGQSLFRHFCLNPPSDTAYSFVGWSLLGRFRTKSPSDTASSLCRWSPFRHFLPWAPSDTVYGLMWMVLIWAHLVRRTIGFVASRRWMEDLCQTIFLSPSDFSTNQSRWRVCARQFFGPFKKLPGRWNTINREVFLLLSCNQNHSI